MLTCDRRRCEELERELLSPEAAHAADSQGRERPEEPDPWRTCYQRDRDRILHCKSFRRLMHKTQVFLSPGGDHYRTRLTHTLEVAQVARSISRGLALNTDLTEAIALGHDLGHTPFGHTGEYALSLALAQHRGRMDAFKAGERLFHHNEQSGRVVRFLEKDGQGLNLSHEVVDGIVNHTGKLRSQTCEGRVVALSDRIAYVNHDIDDAIRAGILLESDLPSSTHRLLGAAASERINTMVSDVISNSVTAGSVQMSPQIWDALDELRTFLFSHVYGRSDAKLQEPKANQVIGMLFDYYMEHFEDVPAEYRLRDGDSHDVSVADFIAGMTDRYALNLFQELFVPRTWAAVPLASQPAQTPGYEHP